MPVKLTAMDEENAIRILGYVEEHGHEVEQAVDGGRALGRRSILNHFWQTEEKTPRWCWVSSGRRCRRFTGSTLFETMLQTMIRELGLSHLAAEGTRMRAAAQSAGD